MMLQMTAFTYQRAVELRPVCKCKLENAQYHFPVDPVAHCRFPVYIYIFFNFGSAYCATVPRYPKFCLFSIQPMDQWLKCSTARMCSIGY